MKFIITNNPQKIDSRPRIFILGQFLVSARSPDEAVDLYLMYAYPLNHTYADKEYCLSITREYTWPRIVISGELYKHTFIGENHHGVFGTADRGCYQWIYR